MQLFLILTLLSISVTTIISTFHLSNWTELSNGPYSKREGLMGVSYRGNIYMSGGRETYGVAFSNEVWRSPDGKTWTLASKGPFKRNTNQSFLSSISKYFLSYTSGPFGSRAYHVMLVVGDCMLITGGQTFFSFYNDVWKR